MSDGRVKGVKKWKLNNRQIRMLRHCGYTRYDVNYMQKCGRKEPFKALMKLAEKSFHG